MQLWNLLIHRLKWGIKENNGTSLCLLPFFEPLVCVCAQHEHILIQHTLVCQAWLWYWCGFTSSTASELKAQLFSVCLTGQKQKCVFLTYSWPMEMNRRGKESSLCWLLHLAVCLRSSLNICTLDQGHSWLQSNHDPLYLYFVIYLYTLVNAWLVTMSHQTFHEYVYMCSLVAINNASFVLCLSTEEGFYIVPSLCHFIYSLVVVVNSDISCTCLKSSVRGFT